MKPLTNERLAAMTPIMQRMIRDRQQSRRAMRTLRQDSSPRRIPECNMMSYLTGGVHMERETFLKAAKIKSRARVHRNKRPTNRKRWCAIEIEMTTLGDVDTVVDALCDVGAADFAHLKTDGSVRGSSARPNAHELVLCAELERMPEVIDRVCEALKRPDVNAGVNKTCGLHIHLDMRNDDVDTAYRNLVHSYEPLLSKLVPESRVVNTYCKPPTTADFEDAQGEDDRYRAINSCAYSAHTTLEVRIFAGSVNANKIKQYLAIVSSIAYAEDDVPRNLETADQWAQHVGWEPKLTAWVKERAQNFGHSL